MELDHNLEWTFLPDIPSADGLAGIYSGISSDVLLVAGGCNFPGGARPWTQGVKSWYSDIYLLDNARSSWQIVGQLPRAMAYGISLSWNNKVICLGGRDGDEFYNNAFMLSWEGGQLIIENLPDLPSLHANGCGVVVGNTIYVAGGQCSAIDQGTMKNFWSIDLSLPPGNRKWEILEPIPGPSRMLSVASTCGEHLYLFSGVHLPGGLNPQREYLTDCYRFTLKDGWQQLPEMPYAVAAAPSPATFIKDRIVLLGGDDGMIASKGAVLKEAHPGFTRNILHFNPYSETWTLFSSLPSITCYKSLARELLPPVTTPSVQWQGRIVIPGGEIKPGFRTSQVIAGSFKTTKSL